MSAPPYMRFFVGDYLADTTHLSTLEHGAYLLLLMAMWRAGGQLPSDPARLARIALMSRPDWDAIAPVILEFFSLHGRFISHTRLIKELQPYTNKVRAQKIRREREQLLADQQNQTFGIDKLSHNQNQNQIRDSLPLQVVEYESENVVPLSSRMRPGPSAEEFG